MLYFVYHDGKRYDYTNAPENLLGMTYTVWVNGTFRNVYLFAGFTRGIDAVRYCDALNSGKVNL